MTVADTAALTPSGPTIAHGEWRCRSPVCLVELLSVLITANLSVRRTMQNHSDNLH